MMRVFLEVAIQKSYSKVLTNTTHYLSRDEIVMVWSNRFFE